MLFLYPQFLKKKGTFSLFFFLSILCFFLSPQSKIFSPCFFHFFSIFFFSPPPVPHTKKAHLLHVFFFFSFLSRFFFLAFSDFFPVHCRNSSLPLLFRRPYPAKTPLSFHSFFFIMPSNFPQKKGLSARHSFHLMFFSFFISFRQSLFLTLPLHALFISHLLFFYLFFCHCFDHCSQKIHSLPVFFFFSFPAFFCSFFPCFL